MTIQELTKNDILMAMADCLGCEPLEFQDWSKNDILNYLNNCEKQEVFEFLDVEYD